MTKTHTQTAELPVWLNVLIFLILIVILAFFGDVFTMVVGIIGVCIAFTAYFNRAKPQGGHH